jgi:hypothetical protein
VSTVPFRVPTGVAPQPNGGGASPESLIAGLRARAAERREAEELVVALPGRWEGRLRARYGYIGLDDLETYEGVDLAHTSGVGMTTDMLAKACRAIEAYDPEAEAWEPLRDELGPVTFDDRLTRLLAWPRPDEDFEYSARQVYEGMFDGNGLAVGQHAGRVARWMGVFEEELASGEASTGGGSTPSPPPPPSG